MNKFYSSPRYLKLLVSVINRKCVSGYCLSPQRILFRRISMWTWIKHASLGVWSKYEYAIEHPKLDTKSSTAKKITSIIVYLLCVSFAVYVMYSALTVSPLHHYQYIVFSSLLIILPRQISTIARNAVS